MVQLILSSASLFGFEKDPVSTSIIDTGSALEVPYNYYDVIYGNAKFNIPSLVFSDKKATRKMYLKSFRGTYLQMTTEKNYNNHFVVNNVTDGTSVNYKLEPKLFNTVPDYVAYLNTVCTDLTFSWNDPSTTPQNYNEAVDKCVIEVSGVGSSLYGKSWSITFDRKSISRSLGFELGTTPVVLPAIGPNPAQKLIGITPFTTTSIGRIYMSVQVGSSSLSNSNVAVSYIIYVQGDNLENTPAKSLSFSENRDFSQSIEVTSSQFNQLVVSLKDEFNNIIYLNGHYSFVLDIE